MLGGMDAGGILEKKDKVSEGGANGRQRDSQKHWFQLTCLFAE